MGQRRVKCLVVVLTWTLLGLVQGWKQINEEQLQEIWEGRYPFVSVNPDDHHAEYDNNFDGNEENEEDEDDLFYDSEGEATEDGLDHEAQFRGPRPTTSEPDENKDPTGFDFKCTENGFIISMAKEKLGEVEVIGPKDLQLLDEVPDKCGYAVNAEEGTLSVPFSGCFVKNQNVYSLQLLFGKSQVRTAECKGPKLVQPKLSPRANEESVNCPFSIPETPTPGLFFNPPQQTVQIPPLQEPRIPPPPAHNCAVPMVEQVACGRPWISASDCRMMGCCVNPSTSSCFYPVDECTEDRHFVFAIRHDSASIPLDPRSLIIPGTNCKPVIVTDTAAVFKFKMTECGARAFNVGQTQINLAEVQTPVESLSLKYGVISRSNQVRFLIECRYSLSAQQSLASTGYMVKTPSSTLPSAVLSDGLYGVELKIAEDETYSHFYPTYHQPLRLLLGKPVHLQLNLLSPTPEAVILVNYCIAYPRSANNALVLVYEGCANPNDPQTSVLLNSEYARTKYERRFVVKAFQFMDQNTNKYLDEEIYFMCSTEVCFPTERTCEERCFDGRPPQTGGRKN